MPLKYILFIYDYLNNFSSNLQRISKYFISEQLTKTGELSNVTMTVVPTYWCPTSNIPTNSLKIDIININNINKIINYNLMLHCKLCWKKK